MAERLITDAERMELQECLNAAMKRREILDYYIVGLEEELRRGVVWQYDPEAFKEMCSRVEEAACRSRKQYEEHEVTRHGHVPTHEERQGWVSPIRGGHRANGKTIDERSVEK